MEKIREISSSQAEKTIIENKIPELHQQPSDRTSVVNSPSNAFRSLVIPDRLKVPKAKFKYPERYTSPTDLMMSPVSKGLLARSRKPSGLLPASKSLRKLQNLQLQKV